MRTRDVFSVFGLNVTSQLDPGVLLDATNVTCVDGMTLLHVQVEISQQGELF